MCWVNYLCLLPKAEHFIFSYFSERRACNLWETKDFNFFYHKIIFSIKKKVIFFFRLWVLVLKKKNRICKIGTGRTNCKKKKEKKELAKKIVIGASLKLMHIIVIWIYKNTSLSLSLSLSLCMSACVR